MFIAPPKSTKGITPPSCMVEYGQVMTWSKSQTASRGLEREKNAPARFPNAYSIKIPPEFQGGHVMLEVVRPGMLVSLCDVVFPQDMTVKYQVEDSPIGFGAIVAGKFEIQCDKASGTSMHSRQPQEIVCKSGKTNGTMHMAGGLRFQMISVNLADDLLGDLLEGNEGYASLLNKFHRERDGDNVFGSWTLTPAMKIIFSQLLRCPLHGVSRRFYIESKALEILALHLDKLLEASPRSFPLSTDDIERLHEARRILFEAYDAPPSLVELASKVGLNDFKLKRGFREVFGTTVYSALRSHRMEIARSLLLEGNMTVGTAAATVGYTNISHFINAFRKQYDVTPGALLQQSRRVY